MSIPGGEEIFETGNEQGFSRYVRYNKKGKRVDKADFEEGVCASMCCMFLRRMFDKGEVTSPVDVGDAAKGQFSSTAHRVAIAHAAYEFGQLSKGATELDDVVSLLDAYGLRSINTKQEKFTVLTIRHILNQLTSTTNHVYFGVSSHAMALVSKVNEFFFFDPDEGLYRWTSKTKFVADMAEYLVADYPDDIGDMLDLVVVSPH